MLRGLSLSSNIILNTSRELTSVLLCPLCLLATPTFVGPLSLCPLVLQNTRTQESQGRSTYAEAKSSPPPPVVDNPSDLTPLALEFVGRTGFDRQVMPFGLTNAPAAFQRFVNSVFADMLDVCVVVYLDDILVYSDNMEDHTKHVREVLQRLHQHKLYAKPEKCEFHSDSVEYLGYSLSPNGLTMLQDKVTTICDWPEPRKVKDIQSFLGFANFYHRFIFNYSDIVVPLTRLTWKDAPWDFSDVC